MLNGKTALITGTNRGIGKSILEEFAKSGANVIAHARKETLEFVSLIDSLKKEYQVEITPIYFDLRNSDEIKEAIKGVYLSKRPIDILVNSAGIYFSAPYSQTSIEKLQEVIQIDFFAPYQITQIILKIMTRQKSGSIVNISSIAGTDIGSQTIAYSCAKASIIAFTKTIASEYGVLGIRCNSVAPGLVDTDMTKNHSEEQLAFFDKLTALKRKGTPSDIAKVVKFLASDESAFITGQNIRIDGGLI